MKKQIKEKKPSRFKRVYDLAYSERWIIASRYTGVAAFDNESDFYKSFYAAKAAFEELDYESVAGLEIIKVRVKAEYTCEEVIPLVAKKVEK